MGFLKEPKGIDLIVGRSIVTEQDKKMISEIIANYKKTKKIPFLKLSTTKNGINATKAKIKF